MNSPPHTSNMPEILSLVLAPCLGEAPTAGAVIVVSSPDNASYTLINMSPLEASHLLRSVSAKLEHQMGGNLETLQ